MAPPKPAATSEKDKRGAPNPKDLASRVTNPLPMFAAADPDKVKVDPVTAANFLTHPYLTFSVPIALLATVYTTLHLLLTRAAVPVLGLVLVDRWHVHGAAAMSLFGSWTVARALIHRRNRELAVRAAGGNRAAVSHSGHVVLTPARLDQLFFSALAAVAAAVLVAAAAPWSRDAAVRFAAHPRDFVDRLLAPLVPVLMRLSPASAGDDTLTTAVTASSQILALLPTAVSSPVTDLLAKYATAPLPPIAHAHMVLAVSLYLPAALLGIAVAALPYISATPYAAPVVLEQHLKFSRLLVPLLWFVAANLTRLVLNWTLPYPEAAVAIVAAVVAVVAGGVVPAVWKPYKLAVPYLPRILAAATLVVVLLGVASPNNQSHYAENLDRPLQINDEYTLLSKRGSTIVLDDTGRDILFMRAGHSIIGGVYKSSGDSVFSGFYYHDMHRLVTDRPLAKFDAANNASDARTAQSDRPRGLMIGYGVGVAAHTYATIGVPLDVVEIDGDVVALAQKWFPIPGSSSQDDDGSMAMPTFHVQDGRAFLEHADPQTYDFVVHDVFTGGSVPSALFTWQTIVHARRVLKPGGTLTVNFVGAPHSPGFKHVAKTLRSVFPSVRCYAETSPEEARESGNDSGLGNLVFLASSQDTHLRVPVEADYLGSQMRWYALSRLAEREEFDRRLRKYEHIPRLLLDNSGTDDLALAMVEVAEKHFEVMRQVLPLDVWLTY
ncbi:hypothetical protein BC828DRAFT_364258 [Blastocladiella britannica]|nr:hypothetical protein BC828DRAFT_364258 [Blastocladiella britannica]